MPAMANGFPDRASQNRFQRKVNGPRCQHRRRKWGLGGDVLVACSLQIAAIVRLWANHGRTLQMRKFKKP